MSQKPTENPAEGEGGDRARGTNGDLDAALARALTLAAEAGQWTVVAQLARELEARRLRGAAAVVPGLRLDG